MLRKLELWRSTIPTGNYMFQSDDSQVSVPHIMCMLPKFEPRNETSEHTPSPGPRPRSAWGQPTSLSRCGPSSCKHESGWMGCDLCRACVADISVDFQGKRSLKSGQGRLSHAEVPAATCQVPYWQKMVAARHVQTFQYFCKPCLLIICNQSVTDSCSCESVSPGSNSW